MPEVLWKALGLMLVFEGLMPFLAPESWQQTLRRLSNCRRRGYAGSVARPSCWGYSS